ncbi:MAG: tRNA glutamyl-Q(34) synthetase GluQRS [Bacteroidaceae bacterium]|nr:tRNA glutamyl-Q(34) synthetase GluQRS [Bacteroidaceae bacterium]
MVGRFAPSPTGRMHLGNVFCALLSWLSAKSKGGEWRLRIEDLDPDRSRRDFALQLMDDLQWLGLSWDGEVVWQSQRFDLYEQYLRQLQDLGLTYPCFCSRADIMATQAPHETDGRVVYAGTCRGKKLDEMAQNTPFATRFMVPNEVITFQDGHYGEQSVNLSQHCGDYVLRRKDGAWAYQLAVVVDDALMGITEVVRGRDLLLSTPQQLHLLRTLGFESPNYFHHPLLVNENGQRLCKRDKGMDLSALREKHKNPDEIVGFLAFLAGLLPSPTPIKPQDLLSFFSWQKVPKKDITCNNLK